jgi:hypothetical protein
MSISSVSINNVNFAQGSEPTLTRGSSPSNTFTINGSGFSGSQSSGDISFNFPGYSPQANAITSQSTTQINGNFVYNPGGTLTGGETQTNLAVTVKTGGVSSSFPGSGTYPIKVN